MAKKLGATVGELERRITSSEFTEWQAEYLLDPWDDDKLMLAQIAYAVCESSGNYKSLKIEQFIPKPRIRIKSDPQAIYQKFRQMFPG